MSLDQWISVLKLSLMWRMTMIHDLALQKIPTCIHNSDQWIDVLKISTQSRIQELREIAIGKLTNELSASMKIRLGIECSIEPWLTAGYTIFATRPKGISAEDEDEFGPSRTSNLFRLRHRRLEAKSLHDVQADIKKTFKSEFADIAAFDSTPRSYFRPDLRTATDPDVIKRDEVYYFVDIIFRVKFSNIFLMHIATDPTSGRRYIVQTSSLPL